MNTSMSIFRACSNMSRVERNNPMETKPLKKVTPEIMALFVSVRDFAESGYGGYTEAPEKTAAR